MADGADLRPNWKAAVKPKAQQNAACGCQRQCKQGDFPIELKLLCGADRHFGSTISFWGASSFSLSPQAVSYDVSQNPKSAFD